MDLNGLKRKKNSKGAANTRFFFNPLSFLSLHRLPPLVPHFESNRALRDLLDSPTPPFPTRLLGTAMVSGGCLREGDDVYAAKRAGGGAAQPLQGGSGRG